MTCRYYIHNRAINHPHICNHDSDQIACAFACDWNLASKRCNCYETDSWALYAVLNTVCIRISKKFDNEKEACNHIEPSWMKNVEVRRCD